MTNKEWLKNITPKDLDLSGNVLLMLDGSVLMLFEDYYWLIKQAKRVHELESDSYNAHLERLLDRKEQEIERYREAIREFIERMDEGGAGTRSFVYEKLIEALEVEGK